MKKTRRQFMQEALAATAAVATGCTAGSVSNGGDTATGDGAAVGDEPDGDALSGDEVVAGDPMPSGFDPSTFLLWDQQSSPILPDDSEATALATAQANDQGIGTGWTDIKVENGGPTTWLANPPVDGEHTDSGSGGWIYTAEPAAVAEFGGVIPGFVSRAYCFEGWMAAFGTQGDYYLRFGDAGGANGQVPGDVWFQFWYFCEAAPDWNHAYSHPKFIYPNRGPYPAQAPDYDWLLTRHRFPQMPWLRGVSNPENSNDHGERYVNFKHGGVLGATPVMSYPNDYTLGDPSAGGAIGQSYQGSPRSGAFEAGGWICMRVRMNTSQAAQEQNRCQLECSTRAYGSPDWQLMSRWTHDQAPEPSDPDAGAVAFEYNLDGATNGYGHKQFVTPANTDRTGVGQPSWAASTAYAVGDVIVEQTNPRAGNKEYECMTAGTSGASEPAWDRSHGATTTDGGVTWRARRIWDQNQRYFLSDIIMVAGTDSGGAGAAVLPELADYGY